MCLELRYTQIVCKIAHLRFPGVKIANIKVTTRYSSYKQFAAICAERAPQGNFK